MKKTKGFITLATGNEEYYKLAKNLLHSYRYFCEKPLPFAILADRENEYTSEFDDVLIFSNGATNSYLDKLSLGEYLPYDINVFIDSDCLAYGDLNQIFDFFENADDFSCFGRVLPLDDTTGWFEYENLGDLKSQVSYVIGLHGGIYYMRKGKVCQKIFQSAKSFIGNYPKYKFKGKFSTPGDEPLIALSMAVNNCKPIPFKSEAICCYWEYVNRMKLEIEKGLAKIINVSDSKTILVHWGTRYTKQLQYQKQIEILSILESNGANKEKQINSCKRKYGYFMAVEKCKSFAIRAKNKVLRMIGAKK